MKKLDTDNWFFRAMGVVGDWAILSVLWLVCCLPIVTAGASTLALFAVAHKMAAGQSYTTSHDFFRAFKRDFRQATMTWLPMLAVFVFLAADWGFSAGMAAPWGGLLRGVSLVGLAVWVLAICWGFALLARFTYARGGDALKNGLQLAVRAPQAALTVLLLAVWVPVLLSVSVELFVYLLPVVLLLAPGGGAWGMARAMRPQIAEIERKNNYFVDEEEPQ